MTESWVQKSYIVNISTSGSRALLRNSSLTPGEYEKLKEIYEKSCVLLSKKDLDLLKTQLKKVGLTFSRKKFELKMVRDG